MRTLAAFVLLLAVTGCSGLEARDPLPPLRARAPGPLGVSVKSDYEATDPERPVAGRWSPAIDAAAVERRAHDLFSERLTSSLSEGSRVQLEATVVRSELTYKGQTGVFPLKVFFTIFFFPIDFPNYFIASDRFTLTLTAKWRLVQKGQTIAEGSTEGKETGRFGDFSRGWYFVGYLRMPSPLQPDEWEEIAKTLAPGAQDALAESLVLAAESAFDKPERR